MIQPNPKKKIVKKKQQDDVILFTPEETKERRRRIGLPTSKAEEKKYYKKMEKEGAKNGKTIKKAKSGTTINKAQNGRKLKLSEKYSKTADSLSNEDLRKMTAAGKMTVNRKEPRWKQKTDSLIKSADKDFKGSLEARKKSYELRKKGMKTGGSVKKCKYGCK